MRPSPQRAPVVKNEHLCHHGSVLDEDLSVKRLMFDARLKSAPEPTLRRLPTYYRFIKELQKEGRATVSCSDIGEELKFESTQVRKDLEMTGIVGKPRVGYTVSALLAAIEQFLGFNNANEAFLVGAGSMGSALIGYNKFQEYGLRIVGAFDNDPAKVGRAIHGKTIMPLEQLPEMARQMHILIGIVTVPADAAQQVTELMMASGICAIWNFAPVRLRVPANIILRNEDLYCSLASFSQKVAQALRTRPENG
jgi:redox-sensing transcriptional repressor